VTVEETLQLARSHGVEVRLNAAGDGLNLEVEADPPQALMNVLRRTKWDIVAALRQHELDRRRPLITGWINDHFVSTPLNICRHCGGGAREGDVFVRLYCGDNSGDVHTSCQPAWREVQEAKARAALGLGRLTGMFDHHFPLLNDIEEAKPDDVNDAQWDVAMRGLRIFLATGAADEALRLGWSKGELFRVPPLWSRVDLCGAALLIGDGEVIGVTSSRIGIRTPNGTEQGFYRKPVIDYGLVYGERLKLFGLDASSEEVQLRAFEHTVRFCRDHHGCDLEEAKARVRGAIERPDRAQIA
jgi:hypothetical protein